MNVGPTNKWPTSLFCRSVGSRGGSGLSLRHQAGAPPGVWTDQRLGIAGTVMVDALLNALYSGRLQALAQPEGSIRLQCG